MFKLIREGVKKKPRHFTVSLTVLFWQEIGRIKGLLDSIFALNRVKKGLGLRMDQKGLIVDLKGMIVDLKGLNNSVLWRNWGNFPPLPSSEFLMPETSGGFGGKM